MSIDGDIAGIGVDDVYITQCKNYDRSNTQFIDWYFMSTITKNLASWLEKHSDYSKNTSAKQKVVADFARCNEDQALRVLSAVELLESYYGRPTCIRHSAKSVEHCAGEPVYSLSSSFICFSVQSGDLSFLLRIRLARRRPGFRTRDPLLQLKCSGIKQTIKLENLDDLSTCIESFLDDVQHQPQFETIHRQNNISNGEMSLNERFWLLPKFLACVEDKFDGCQTEYMHPHGRVDVRFEDRGKVIFVELKYLNQNETGLAKLRMATGQILMYGHEPRLNETVAELWVVINRRVSEDDRALLSVCRDITNIKYFAIVEKNRKYSLERLDTDC
ncbi:MAG: hypothetical protein HRT35_30720 [Algicola sp.]|nr:hypothetical protein [Algicola sp.]